MPTFLLQSWGKQGSWQIMRNSSVSIDESGRAISSVFLNQISSLGTRPCESVSGPLNFYDTFKTPRFSLSKLSWMLQTLSNQFQFSFSSVSVQLCSVLFNLVQSCFSCLKPKVKEGVRHHIRVCPRSTCKLTDLPVIISSWDLTAIRQFSPSLTLVSWGWVKGGPSSDTNSTFNSKTPLTLHK